MKERGIVVNNKKGVAPIITTILLILIVLVLAAIIILWGIAFIPEALSKFDSPVENACGEMQFSAELDGEGDNYNVLISNTGNIPIFKFKIKKEGVERADIEDLGESPISVGGSTTLEIGSISGADEIKLIPVLLGKTEKGKIQEYQCPKENWVIISL